MFWVKNILIIMTKIKIIKIDSNNYLLFSLCNSFLNDDNNKINEYFIMNILVYYL